MSCGIVDFEITSTCKYILLFEYYHLFEVGQIWIVLEINIIKIENRKGFLNFGNVFFSNPQSIFIGHKKP